MCCVFVGCLEMTNPIVSLCFRRKDIFIRYLCLCLCYIYYLFMLYLFMLYLFMLFIYVIFIYVIYLCYLFMLYSREAVRSTSLLSQYFTPLSKGDHVSLPLHPGTRRKKSSPSGENVKGSTPAPSNKPDSVMSPFVSGLPTMYDEHRGRGTLPS